MNPFLDAYGIWQMSLQIHSSWTVQENSPTSQVAGEKAVANLWLLIFMKITTFVTQNNELGASVHEMQRKKKKNQ